jgi:uncharacterized integral membrane protein
MENIPESEKTKTKGGTLIHDGKYIQYNVLGNIFEVTSNYIPPLQPVGRGAYGIVWYILLSPLILLLFVLILIISNQFYSLIVAVQPTPTRMKVLP